MRYVIIRDDDTNALTPPDALERLYRPFLERGMPVNLATIPEVDVNTKIPDGSLEGFLMHRNGEVRERVSIGAAQPLVRYLRENTDYRIVQHGCHHDWHEFDHVTAHEAGKRLDQGTRLLREAGFSKPETFVAPYDKISRANYKEVASRFSVISTGWFELGRLPYAWWPGYLAKKVRKARHWRVGKTVLLSHPGCLLSCHRPVGEMLDAIRRSVNGQQLTVLVTHWWEYYAGGKTNEAFIEKLHETADYLAEQKDVKVIAFSNLNSGEINHLG
jgi:hypothetical protein